MHYVAFLLALVIEKEHGLGFWSPQGGKRGEKSAAICWLKVCGAVHVKHVCASSGNHRDRAWKKAMPFHWKSSAQLELFLFNKKPTKNFQHFKCSRSVSLPVLNRTAFQACMWFNTFYIKPCLHLLYLIIFFCFYDCFMMGMITIPSIYSLFTLAKEPQTLFL